MDRLLIFGSLVLAAGVMTAFIHRYFGQSITKPTERKPSAAANVSPFTGEIGFRDEVDDTPHDCGGGGT
jgi:hypothetical protein